LIAGSASKNSTALDGAKKREFVTNLSKAEKIQTHFQALSSAATSLNTASDELTKAVGVLDDALRKLNVGLPVWVTVSRWEDELRRGQDEIGYCKVNGKWGIALCRGWNDDAGGEDTIEGLWLFNDAPREVRLAGVDKLPEVIEALSKEAIETAKKVQEKTKEVRELAGAIEQIANAQKRGMKPPPTPPNATQQPPPPPPPNVTPQESPLSRALSENAKTFPLTVADNSKEGSK